MIDLSKYRIIDLSRELVPGELKLDGRYLHGDHQWGRQIELQEFKAFEARMHFVQTQAHIGVHTEAPYKYSDTGDDLGSVPLESYMGEAVACNFTDKPAGAALMPEDFDGNGAKTGDIILAWGATQDDVEKWPHLSEEAIEWMISTKIKLLAIENISYSAPGTPNGLTYGDAKLILGGVAMVDAIQGLDQIKKPRVFFMGLPLRIRRLTAFNTRAVALEEIDD